MPFQKILGCLCFSSAQGASSTMGMIASCLCKERGVVLGVPAGVNMLKSLILFYYLHRVWLRVNVIFTATLLPQMLYIKRISVQMG